GTLAPPAPVANGQPVTVAGFHGCESSSWKKLFPVVAESELSAMYLLFLSCRYRSLQLALPFGLTASFTFLSTLTSQPAANSLNSLKRSRRPSHCGPCSGRKRGMKANVEPRVCTVVIAATEKEVARRMMSRKTCSMLTSRLR